MDHKELLMQNSKEWLVDELMKEQQRRNKEIQENIEMKRKIISTLQRLIAELK